MATRKKNQRKQRVARSDEYRQEAVKLADAVGVTAAAEQLGIATFQIYNWRGKLRVKETRTEAESRLLDENARLKRELAERTQEAEFSKKRRRTSRVRRSEVRLYRTRKGRSFGQKTMSLARYQSKWIVRLEAKRM